MITVDLQDQVMVRCRQEVIRTVHISSENLQTMCLAGPMYMDGEPCVVVGARQKPFGVSILHALTLQVRGSIR